MVYSAEIKKLPRHFLPADFEIKDWALLEPYFKELAERKIDSCDAVGAMAERRKRD